MTLVTAEETSISRGFSPADVISMQRSTFHSLDGPSDHVNERAIQFGTTVVALSSFICKGLCHLPCVCRPRSRLSICPPTRIWFKYLTRKSSMIRCWLPVGTGWWIGAGFQFISFRQALGCSAATSTKVLRVLRSFRMSSTRDLTLAPLGTGPAVPLPSARLVQVHELGRDPTFSHRRHLMSPLRPLSAVPDAPKANIKTTSVEPSPGASLPNALRSAMVSIASSGSSNPKLQSINR